MDILDSDEPVGVGNTPEFTVSELSGAVKRTLEDRFGRVRVRGEVGRVSRPRSGHIYLDLKDDDAVLGSVIWKGVAARLEIQPGEGDEVIAEGRLTTFPGQSKYQLVIDRMSYAGAGALLAKLERLKAALAAEGLFDPERKRPLPYLPEVIGVVTSPSGAVIRDILHRLADRFPRRVLVWPVAVQGAACAAEVARAIRGFNALPPGGPVPRPDLLIVARGGGSVEDLWGFNEEIVVRAAAESAIPLISAVGHETDTTLIDFAADRRAPTPTAAAEIAVPVRRELMAALAGLEERRLRALARGQVDRALRLRELSRLLPGPDALLASPRQRLDAAGEGLPRALRALVATRGLSLARGSAGRFGAHLLRARVGLAERRLSAAAGRLAPALSLRAARAAGALGRIAGRLSPRLPQRARTDAARRLAEADRRLARAATAQTEARFARLGRAGRMLETLSYRATLARGYAVVRDAAGEALTRAAAVAPGAALEIEFADGRIVASHENGDPHGAEAQTGRRPARGRGRKPEQGSLF